MLNSKCVSLFAVFTLSIASAAKADENDANYAGTSLWRAPVVTSVTIGLMPSSSELQLACQRLESLDAKYSKLPDSYHKQMLQLERQTPLRSQGPVKEFEVELITTMSSDGSVLTDAQRAAFAQDVLQQSGDEDRLFYTQAVESENVDIGSLRLASQPSVPGSLTDSAHKLGLGPLAMRLSTVDYLGKQMLSLVLSDKDLACDMIAHRVELPFAAKAVARLPFDTTVKLKSFYMQLSDATRSIASRYRSLARRSAALGMRLNSLYSSLPGVSHDRAERAVLTAVDAFYEPKTMEPNSLWTSIGAQKSLVLSGVSDPFSLQVTVGSGQ